MYNSRKVVRITLATLVALGSACLAVAVSNAQRTNNGATGSPSVAGAWTPVSDGVLKELADQGKKVGYPGLTAGVTVDRTDGDVYMIVPDQGIWKSSDRGATFARVDGGNLGGRCETGYTLNFDPQGHRLVGFMLDGTAAMMSGGGSSWSTFHPNGRGWDFGAVDWSVANPQTLLAIHHESGEELNLSTDGGKSWKLLGKDYTAVGVFDASTLVASQGAGIVRSTDLGVTWTKVADQTPTGRAMCVFRGAGYWVSKEGLLVSRDKGQSWKVQGSPIEAAWGPFFGKSEREICVVGRMGGVSGIWKTVDSGKNWVEAAPFPAFEHENGPDWTPSKQWAAGWFTNFGWDPVSNVFYASRMGHPTYKFDPR